VEHDDSCVQRVEKTMLGFDAPILVNDLSGAITAPFVAPRLDHSALALALVDRIACGVVAVGPSGELHYANRAARAEFKRARALHLQDNVVSCSSTDTKEWRATLHEAAVKQRGQLIWLGAEAERLMVVAMPMQAGTLAAPAALLMLGRRSVCSTLGLEMLASRHGLTLAERRVLAALVENQSTTEIAATHGVAMATIRTQIQSIRDKLQVRSIDALLLRAAEVPPISSLH
jgi:DNA-binding CsgD family transcriptional regulator